MTYQKSMFLDSISDGILYNTKYYIHFLEQRHSLTLEKIVDSIQV